MLFYIVDRPYYSGGVVGITHDIVEYRGLHDLAYWSLTLHTYSAHGMNWGANLGLALRFAQTNRPDRPLPNRPGYFFVVVCPD